MIQPIKYKSREPLNSLTGIKSSLAKLRSVIALTYLLYLANEKKDSISYSIANGSGILLKEEYKQFIESYLHDNSLEAILQENPLLKSQIESLYVGVTLMFALGKISFENKNFSMTKERTGGNRYPKVINYASNIITLDLILCSIEENQRISFLKSWLKDEHLENEIELKVSTFLNLCIENNLFKLRNGDKDLFFQSEGIYLGLNQSDTVSLDSDEKVGPARILNSMLSEGLVPWLTVKQSAVSYNTNCPFDHDAYSKIISTSLDIRDIKNDKDIGAGKDVILSPSILKHQLIYYGAPGTGKSHKTEEVTAKYPETVRTTFHPDSDYSTFVGAYKPTTTNIPRYGLNSMGGTVAMQVDGKALTENKIEYKFVKQAFLKAYIKAWNLFMNTCEDGQELAPQFLVIEEINRGNCAQIFGDLFQLLDRKKNFSEYPIEADEDIRKALKEDNPEDGLSFGKDGLQLNDEQKAYINNVYDKPGQPSRNIAEKICSGQLLVLPPNFYIWATMNTSDQSLFPIDSAFKRRWDWKYVPITKKDKNYKIRVKAGDGKTYDYDWWNFLQKVNEAVSEVTSSEDKKLGYFFCKADENNTINADTFVGKVLFYLFGDVLKDYDTDDVSFTFDNIPYTLLRWKDGDKQGRFKFSQFFNEDGDGDDVMVTKFLDNIKVIKTIVDDTTLDDEEEEKLEADITGGSVDRSKYSFNGNGNYGKSNLGRTIMEKYIKEHPELTFDQIKSTFPDSMLNGISGPGLIVKDGIDLASYSRYYISGYITSDGVNYSIYKQWTIGNIPNIIHFAEEQNWKVDKL